MRFFESIEKHLRIADKGDVKTAIEMVAVRNSNGWVKSGKGDEEIWMGPSIPKSWFWNPEFSKINPTDMSKDERNDYYAAFSKVHAKLAHKVESRFI